MINIHKMQSNYNLIYVLVNNGIFLFVLVSVGFSLLIFQHVLHYLYHCYDLVLPTCGSGWTPPGGWTAGCPDVYYGFENQDGIELSQGADSVTTFISEVNTLFFSTTHFHVEFTLSLMSPVKIFYFKITLKIFHFEGVAHRIIRKSCISISNKKIM